jgi:hypothetical protein
LKINQNAALFLVAACVSCGAGASMLVHNGWPLIITAVFLLVASLSVDVDRGE